MLTTLYPKLFIFLIPATYYADSLTPSFRQIKHISKIKLIHIYFEVVPLFLATNILKAFSRVLILFLFRITKC